MKAAALAIVALSLIGCSERSLTRPQMAAIAQVGVIITAAPEVPFVRQPPTSQPARRPALDTSKGAGTAVQAVGNALADASAAEADRRSEMTIATAASSFLAEVRTNDFPSEMFTATQRALAQATAVRAVATTPVLTSRDRAVWRSLYDRSTANAVLFFTVEYSFVELYGIHYYVHFNGNASMFPKADGLKQLRRRPDDSDPLADGNAIYRKHFESVLRYRPGNGAAIFKQAAEELAAKLAADLNRDN